MNKLDNRQLGLVRGGNLCANIRAQQARIADLVASGKMRPEIAQSIKFPAVYCPAQVYQ
ncbi:hypothetical protein SAMN04487985_11837 [Aerococcus urinaehominis]|uniref:hypothetical protein n=1 Tax=Aerococcus urinaehominis TaxID=128944 RepID=UPI00087F00A3|nr:hypothetical protein [Aerococcus urinaehominis]SDM47544.1 hypothetical protein SAMN04487985_11837 [Aerococcus urinaehominis]